MNIQFFTKGGILAMLLAPLLSFAQSGSPSQPNLGSQVGDSPSKGTPVSERNLKDPEAYSKYDETKNAQQKVPASFLNHVEAASPVQTETAVVTASPVQTETPIVTTPVVEKTAKSSISRQELMKCKPERQQHVLAHPEEFEVTD